MSCLAGFNEIALIVIQSKIYLLNALKKKQKIRFALFFCVRLLMYYHYDIQAQLKRIFKKIDEKDLVNSSSRQDSNRIFDFYDGAIYQNLLKSQNGDSFRKKESLTLMLNTDGISRSIKSNQTIWPIFLVVNELSSQNRFCIDNVIVAGIYIY